MKHLIATLVGITALPAFALAAETTPVSISLWHWLIVLAVLGGFVGLYLLPAIIAWRRQHNNRTAIALANILLGWSLFGWVAALVWAFTNPTRKSSS